MKKVALFTLTIITVMAMPLTANASAPNKHKTCNMWEGNSVRSGSVYMLYIPTRTVKCPKGVRAGTLLHPVRRSYPIFPGWK